MVYMGASPHFRREKQAINLRVFKGKEKAKKTKTGNMTSAYILKQNSVAPFYIEYIFLDALGTKFENLLTLVSSHRSGRPLTRN